MTTCPATKALTRSESYLRPVLLLILLSAVLIWSVPSHGADQDDAGSGTDAGNSQEVAFVLENVGTWSASVGGEDKDDWYAIDLERGAILFVALSVPNSADLDLYIYPAGSGATGTVRYHTEVSRSTSQPGA